MRRRPGCRSIHAHRLGRCQDHRSPGHQSVIAAEHVRSSRGLLRVFRSKGRHLAVTALERLVTQTSHTLARGAHASRKASARVFEPDNSRRRPSCYTHRRRATAPPVAVPAAVVATIGGEGSVTAVTYYSTGSDVGGTGFIEPLLTSPLAEGAPAPPSNERPWLARPFTAIPPPADCWLRQNRSWPLHRRPTRRQDRSRPLRRRQHRHPFPGQKRKLREQSQVLPWHQEVSRWLCVVSTQRDPFERKEPVLLSAMRHPVPAGRAHALHRLAADALVLPRRKQHRARAVVPFSGC